MIEFTIHIPDVNIEPGQRQVPQLPVVVEEQSGTGKKMKNIISTLLAVLTFWPSILIIVIVIVAVRGISEGDVVVQVGVLLVYSAVFAYLQVSQII